jgi:hypothetical protein
LWLLSNIKLLTRDNLGKRRKVDDQTCIFYNEPKSVSDLFFGCAVASQASKNISDVVGFPIGLYYESVAKCCLCNKKFKWLIS